MEAIGNAINWVKDGYVRVIDWAEAHPHVMAWALGLSLLSRVFV